MTRGALVLLSLMLAATPRAAPGQAPDAAVPAWTSQWTTPVGSWRADGAQDEEAALARDALTAGLVSALLPGTGQFLQGRGRWILFLTAEAAAWAFHLDARQDGRRLRTGYRDLAWTVARGAPQPRVDGPFEYYERMSHWIRSGNFDSDPGSPELEPERDHTTYNGSQWRLAAEIYLQGDPHVPPGVPGYPEALEYYRARAYETQFIWDWSDAPDDLDRFRSLIERSDDRFRTASVALALVAGNHILSAVDAFAAARLRPPPADLALRLQAGPAPHYQPYLVFRLSLP